MFEKDISRLKKRIERHSNRENLIVFYGSSSIRLWVNITKDLTPLNVINLGFGGSSFEWLNNYFGDLFESLVPQHVVLYGGDNDLSHGLSPIQISHGFRKLVEKFETKFPEIVVHGISVKPSPKRMNMLDKITETNDLISKCLIKGDNKPNFIDIFNPMLDHEENLKDFYMSDMLHMNRSGYQIWTNEVRYYFKEEGLLD